MKKFSTTITIFFSSLFFLNSCNQTEDVLISQDNCFSLSCFQTGWTEDSSREQTRVVTDSEGKGSFVENDCIEIQIKSEAKTTTTQLTYVGGQWTPNLQRSDYGKGELHLTGIFPILSQYEGDVSARKISLPVQQHDKQNYAAADILFGSTTVDASSTSAVMQFRHALHRIFINLKGSVPDDLKIEIRSRTEGKISIASGNVTLTEEAEPTYTWITPQQETSNIYTAIILPQEAEAYRNGDGLIRLTSEGKSVTYPLNSDIESFSPGMQTTFNLTLKSDETGGSADMDFCNQTYWVYGITSPDFPGKENIQSYTVDVSSFPEGEWMRYAYEKLGLPNEENYLTWKEGCGWYDCNKTFQYIGDRNMCWAATASNLIHWWLEHNRKYIEAYEAKYGGDPCPMGYRKMTEKDQNHSEVFNFFKASFPNQGSWDTGGVNWFINGNKQNLTYCYNENFEGFFSKVFSKSDAVATETRNLSKENFNLWMKNAFRTNKAIGFSANGFVGPNGSRHSMTIWGAEFDAEGNVAFLYFCDNNYGEEEPNHASMRRFKVKYKENTTQGTYLTPLDYNDGTQPKAQAVIGSLTLVDLRLDIWKAAFPDVK